MGVDRSRPRARVTPLVLATMASQALLVVLGPTIVAIGADLGASVGAVGQARSITAVVAAGASVLLSRRLDAVGVRRVLAAGALLAIVGAASRQGSRKWADR